MKPYRGGGAVQTAARTAEGRRLAEARLGAPWRRWGPYVSERQWGTVREDYSADGDAWEYFPHDHARSRAYRWGEDGIGGFGDEHLYLCLGVALWNERDPILKERLFGLTNSEGNHGEDVKEIYYYLDGTPTHSYLRIRMLSLAQVADEIADRLCHIFLPDSDGARPVFGGDRRFVGPNFRDHLLFHEYFHGDSGRGLGAAHQTGWTGLIALLLQMRSAARARAADAAAGISHDRIAAAD